MTIGSQFWNVSFFFSCPLDEAIQLDADIFKSKNNILHKFINKFAKEICIGNLSMTEIIICITTPQFNQVIH